MSTDEFTAMVAKVKTDKPQLASRVDRAAALLRSHLENRSAGLIRARVFGEVWTYTVRSQSSDGHYKVVRWADGSWSCDCPDAAQRRVACKHVLACRLLRKLMN